MGSPAGTARVLWHACRRRCSLMCISDGGLCLPPGVLPAASSSSPTPTREMCQALPSSRTSSLLLPETPRHALPSGRSRGNISDAGEADERGIHGKQARAADLHESFSQRGRTPRTSSVDEKEEGDRLYREAMVLYSLIGDDEGTLCIRCSRVSIDVVI